MEAAASLENQFSALVAKKYLIVSFDFSSGSVITGQGRWDTFLRLCREVSLPTYPRFSDHKEAGTNPVPPA